MKTLIFSSLALVACSKTETTTPGPLGSANVRLPSGVTAPADAELRSHEATRTICATPGYDGADVKVRWKTFAQGADAYIVSWDIALMKSADALTVTMGPVDSTLLLSANLTPGAPFMQVEHVNLKCVRKTMRLEQTGSEMIPIRADGESPLPR